MYIAFFNIYIDLDWLMTELSSILVLESNSSSSPKVSHDDNANGPTFRSVHLGEEIAASSRIPQDISLS